MEPACRWRAGRAATPPIGVRIALVALAMVVPAALGQVSTQLSARIGEADTAVLALASTLESLHGANQGKGCAGCKALDACGTALPKVACDVNYGTQAD